MMSFLKECRKHKKQDRLAREIAMNGEREAGGKGGFSPLETL